MATREERRQRRNDEEGPSLHDQLAARLDQLVEKMDSPESKKFVDDLLRFQAATPRYSPFNAQWLLQQWAEKCMFGKADPDVLPSRFASFKAWKGMGQDKGLDVRVLKGEESYRVLVPKKKTVEVEADEDTQELAPGEKQTKTKIKITGFIAGPVFAIEQTNARELGLVPLIAASSRVHDEAAARKVAAAIEKVYGVTVHFETALKFRGFYRYLEREIHVDRKDGHADRSGDDMIATLLHELGHHILHGDGLRSGELEYHTIHEVRRDCEAEAEAFSYALCSVLGVERPSENYLQCWGSSKEHLSERLPRLLAAVRAASKDLDLEHLLALGAPEVQVEMPKETAVAAPTSPEMALEWVRELFLGLRQSPEVKADLLKLLLTHGGLTLPGAQGALIVSPDLSEVGKWRLTRFDQQEQPINHSVCATPQAALSLLLDETRAGPLRLVATPRELVKRHFAWFRGEEANGLAAIKLIQLLGTLEGLELPAREGLLRLEKRDSDYIITERRNGEGDISYLINLSAAWEGNNPLLVDGALERHHALCREAGVYRPSQLHCGSLREAKELLGVIQKLEPRWQLMAADQRVYGPAHMINAFGELLTHCEGGELDTKVEAPQAIVASPAIITATAPEAEVATLAAAVEATGSEASVEATSVATATAEAAAAQLPKFLVKRSRGNSGKVTLAPMPGTQFTAEETAILRRHFTEQGYYLHSRGPLVILANEDRLAAIVPPQEIEKARLRAEREERVKAERQERQLKTQNDYAVSPASTWLDEQLGEDRGNLYNALALARYLDGSERKFNGIFNPSWANWLQELGVVESGADGRVLVDDQRRPVNSAGELIDILGRIREEYQAQLLGLSVVTPESTSLERFLRAYAVSLLAQVQSEPGKHPEAPQQGPDLVSYIQSQVKMMQSGIAAGKPQLDTGAAKAACRKLGIKATRAGLTQLLEPVVNPVAVEDSKAQDEQQAWLEKTRLLNEAGLAKFRAHPAAEFITTHFPLEKISGATLLDMARFAAGASMDHYPVHVPWQWEEPIKQLLGPEADVEKTLADGYQTLYQRHCVGVLVVPPAVEPELVEGYHDRLRRQWAKELAQSPASAWLRRNLGDSCFSIGEYLDFALYLEGKNPDFKAPNSQEAALLCGYVGAYDSDGKDISAFLEAAQKAYRRGDGMPMLAVQTGSWVERIIDTPPGPFVALPQPAVEFDYRRFPGQMLFTSRTGPEMNLEEKNKLREWLMSLGLSVSSRGPLVAFGADNLLSRIRPPHETGFGVDIGVAEMSPWEERQGRFHPDALALLKSCPSFAWIQQHLPMDAKVGLDRLSSLAAYMDGLVDNHRSMRLPDSWVAPLSSLKLMEEGDQGSVEALELGEKMKAMYQGGISSPLTISPKELPPVDFHVELKAEEKVIWAHAEGGLAGLADFVRGRGVRVIEETPHKLVVSGGLEQLVAIGRAEQARRVEQLQEIQASAAGAYLQLRAPQNSPFELHQAMRHLESGVELPQTHPLASLQAGYYQEQEMLQTQPALSERQIEQLAALCRSREFQAGRSPLAEVMISREIQVGTAKESQQLLFSLRDSGLLEMEGFGIRYTEAGLEALRQWAPETHRREIQERWQGREAALQKTSHDLQGRFSLPGVIQL